MAKRNEAGIKPIKSDLAKISGITSYTDVVAIVAEQHKYGVNSFFGIGVGQDMKDVNKNITYLGQGGIGLQLRDQAIVGECLAHSVPGIEGHHQHQQNDRDVVRSA